MAICNQCNQEINQDANFCPYCGAVRDSVVTELHGTVIDSSLNLAKPFVPGHKRAQLVKAFLVITILLNVVLIVPAYAETRPNYLPGSHPLDFLWLFWFFNFLITAILFLMWIYRSNKNLTALGAGETDFSPRSSVLWWFVPIMNIYKPKKIVEEIWEWSVGMDTPLLSLWWWLFVIDHYGLPFLDSSSWGSLITLLIDTPAAVLAIMVVHKIDAAQAAKMSASYLKAMGYTNVAYMDPGFSG